LTLVPEQDVYPGINGPDDRNGSIQDSVYRKSLCNEILLYPYYLASLLIEQEYVQRVGTYRPFEGICYTDTLQRGPQPEFLSHLNRNALFVKKKHQLWWSLAIHRIMLGIDTQNGKLISGLRRAIVLWPDLLYGTITIPIMYGFLRWSTDRLHGQAGILCFITNNSFVAGHHLMACASAWLRNLPICITWILAEIPGEEIVVETLWKGRLALA